VSFVGEVRFVDASYMCSSAAVCWREPQVGGAMVASRRLTARVVPLLGYPRYFLRRLEAGGRCVTASVAAAHRTDALQDSRRFFPIPGDSGFGSSVLSAGRRRETPRAAHGILTFHIVFLRMLLSWLLTSSCAPNSKTPSSKYVKNLLWSSSRSAGETRQALGRRGLSRCRGATRQRFRPVCRVFFLPFFLVAEKL
jgi:hypothetical protein